MRSGKKLNSNESRQSQTGLLGILRKNIILRAGLVLFTIVLTAVLLFSLTVAWYTNVVQTGGLTFTAEKWNFDGTINLLDVSAVAAPGTEGIIPMQLTNEGMHTIAASVTVSKDRLDSRMKNRMYFYVDTSTVRNGELMEQVWVSSNKSYTYAIFPGSELVLNESTQNAPALKWRWVYDVVGYYVSGTETTNGGMSVQEFIRPIEYEYDPVYTIFDSHTGYPIKVNADTTAEEFLAQITATDGYPGTLDESVERNTLGYYPVDVDDNGHGVWLYLCTYKEIQDNMAIDVKLGNPETTISGQVTITVTGQNSREEAIEIDDATALVEALNRPGTGHLKLTNDITLTETINLTGSSYAILDLGGYTLHSTAQEIISADPGETIVLLNGELTGNGANGSAAVYSSGANVTLNNVDISNVDEGLKIFDHQNTYGADSRIHLVDCTIRGKEDGLWIYGNGDASDRNTAIVIENCQITGEGYAGIICNGSASYRGTDIQITGGSVAGYYAGIYHPAKDSILTATEAKITGMTGVVAKGGTIYLVNCEISGTATQDEAQPPALSNSGWSDTGDGVYLEAAYEWQTTVYISGRYTKITSVAGEAVRNYMEDVKQADIIVSGGTFSHDVTEYLIDGATCTDNGDGTYTVVLNNP